MLKQVVVTEVSFDQRAFRDAHIGRSRDQLAAQSTSVNVTFAFACQHVHAITNDSICDTTAQVCVHCRHPGALVTKFDFTKLFLGGTFRSEIENARRVGWTIQLSPKAADDFNLLVFFESGGRRDGDSHAVLARVLHIAALHAAVNTSRPA